MYAHHLWAESSLSCLIEMTFFESSGSKYIFHIFANPLATIAELIEKGKFHANNVNMATIKHVFFPHYWLRWRRCARENLVLVVREEPMNSELWRITPMETSDTAKPNWKVDSEYCWFVITSLSLYLYICQIALSLTTQRHNVFSWREGNKKRRSRGVNMRVPNVCVKAHTIMAFIIKHSQ